MTWKPFRYVYLTSNVSERYVTITISRRTRYGGYHGRTYILKAGTPSFNRMQEYLKDKESEYYMAMSRYFIKGYEYET